MAPEIILYHYSFSPYAKRIIWYLTLRRIPYSQCLQPVVMPRPDLTALGVGYRRIPVVAIGRDIYHDTRLVLRKLEVLFPESASHPSISPTTPDQHALSHLLETWTIDGGVFPRAVQLMPATLPILQDKKFTTDRAQYLGRPWEASAQAAGRPEGLTETRLHMSFLETTLLADGRAWLLNTPSPSLADVHAVWPFVWLCTMPDAMPAAWRALFPRTYAWIARFEDEVARVLREVGAPRSLAGAEATRAVRAAAFVEEVGVLPGEADGLVGRLVEVWPTDSGSANRDRGVLVGVAADELVVLMEGERGVRVHVPRHGFRVRGFDGGKL